MTKSLLTNKFFKLIYSTIMTKAILCVMVSRINSSMIIFLRNFVKSMFDFHLFLECGVPYNTKSTLRQHKMAIHPSTNGGQSYPCTRPGCTRVFKVAAKLRMHDDVVHKNLEGKYKCQFCPKKFWGKSSLREHTNGVHLNEKPHKCTLCDFSSAYRSKY